MAIERVDNWELVLTDADLDANNRYKIEDSHIRCALIREIGTDQATPMVDFGLRDHPFMDIDTFIAPYYKSSNNLNVMRLSGKKGLKWTFTGFELPLPLDLELELNGLTGSNRVYMKGTLYKNVMSADEPINQYLMARLIEHNYKQLRPVYWRDITIPAGFDTADEEYVLDDVADALVPWKPQDPKYTIAPPQNITYVIKNTIQVMWGDEDLLPKDVEFRLKHNRIDVGVMPRLDHMFLPPADGITRYVEETFKSTNRPLSIDNCEVVWVDSEAGADVTVSLETTIKKEGVNSVKAVSVGVDQWVDGTFIYKDLATPIDISGFKYVGFWIGAVGSALAAGAISLLLDETAACASPIEKIALPPIPIAVSPATMTYVMVPLDAAKNITALKSVGLMNTSGGAISTGDGLYVDDVRPLPVQVSHNPMEELVKTTFTGGVNAAVSAVNYADGSITLTYDTIPTELLVGYYAFRTGGGRDIFSLREIKELYHKVTYPHKQSYVFINKTGDTPGGAATMDLYTLAEYYQTIPSGQEISPSTLAAARALLV
jgi:hypothetical protein